MRRTSASGSGPLWAEPAATSASLPPATPAPPASAPPRPAAPYAAKVQATLTRYLKPSPERPGYAGAVALVMQDGQTRLVTAVGHALRYGAGPVELPAAERVAMRTDSVFDLASLTKVYTTILVLLLVDQGKVALDAPVRRYLPDFTGPGKERITVALLLAHTSALPVGAQVTGFSGNAERWQSVLRTPLVKGGVPGTTFRYSSVGLMMLGRLVAKLTGKSLAKALRDT